MNGPNPAAAVPNGGSTTVLEMRLYPLIECLKALGDSHWLAFWYLSNRKCNLTLSRKETGPHIDHSRVLALSQSVGGLEVMVESWFNVQGSGRAFVPDFEQRRNGSVISTQRYIQG